LDALGEIDAGTILTLLTPCRNRVMGALLATVLGGVLGITGAAVGALATGRGQANRWRRDAQLRSSTEFLAALQELVRRMIDLAHLAEKPARGDPGLESSAYRDATIAWNSAIYAALLVSPPHVAVMVQAIDREVDRLVDLAIAQRWSRAGFRDERRVLRKLAERYLNAMRSETGWPPLQIDTVWAWDEQETPSPPRPEAVR